MAINLGLPLSNGTVTESVAVIKCYHISPVARNLNVCFIQ